jgi:hypothetical protein
MNARRCLGCFHQQEAQQRIALLADVSKSLLASTGVLTRNHPHVRADLLATLKPSRSSDDQHVSAEVFYEGQYQKWNTTALYAGCLFPIGKHYQFDYYYEHQNITSKRPNNPTTRSTEQGERGYVLVAQTRYVDRSPCGTQKGEVVDGDLKQVENWTNEILLLLPIDPNGDEEQFNRCVSKESPTSKQLFCLATQQLIPLGILG